MPEPATTNSTDALLRRPLDLLALTDVQQLQTAALRATERAVEAHFLEGCALAAELTPEVTHEALRARPATYFHELHSLVMERALRAMPADVARDLLPDVALEEIDAVAMRSQCELFRRDPGLFIPGARPASRIAFLSRGHDLDGWIELADGTVLPWAYAPGGVGRTAIAEASRYVAATPGIERAVVVGTHVMAGFALPGELLFVCISPSATIRNPGPGPEAA
jgi:hypothetical protein